MAALLLQSHMEHYVDWFHVMLIKPALPCADRSDKSKVMECCALHLVQGITMLSTAIKSGTIKLYLVVEVSISIIDKHLDLLLAYYD